MSAEEETKREDPALRMSAQMRLASPGRYWLGDPSGHLPPLHPLPPSSALYFTMLAAWASPAGLGAPGRQRQCLVLHGTCQELGVAHGVCSTEHGGTDGGGGSARPISHSDLDPEASTLTWADSGEPEERQLSLSSLPSGTPGLDSQLTPLPWPY